MPGPRKPAGRPRTLDRAAALDAAMRLFWQHGYEGTSLADLTRAMGMSPPSIYEAFGDKEALYRRALARYQAGRVEEAAPILAGGGPAVEAVVALILRSVEQVTRPGDPPGCLVSGAPGACSPRNEAIVQAAAEAREALVARVEARLAQGARAGEIDERVDLGGVARFVAAILQGISTQARDGIPRAALATIAALGADAVRLALPPGGRAP